MMFDLAVERETDMTVEHEGKRNTSVTQDRVQRHAGVWKINSGEAAAVDVLEEHTVATKLHKVRF